MDNQEPLKPTETHGPVLDFRNPKPADYDALVALYLKLGATETDAHFHAHLAITGEGDVKEPADPINGPNRLGNLGPLP